MITLVFGLPRVGKSAYLTSLATNFMIERDIYQEDIMNCKRFTNQLNSQGWDFHSPPDHLCFADFKISTCGFGIAKKQSYWCSAYYLGLPNYKHPTILLPPYARIILDESQKYFNSRMSAKFEDFISRFYELHGHMHYDIYLACQRAKLIDLNIREIVGRFVEITKLDIKKDKDGNIRKMTWHCNEFYSNARVEQYLQTSDSKFIEKKTTQTVNFDVFKFYDSHFFLPLFFNGRTPEKSNYFLYKEPIYDLSEENIKKFNLLHDYKTPKTFYKGKSE